MQQCQQKKRVAGSTQYRNGRIYSVMDVMRRWLWHIFICWQCFVLYLASMRADMFYMGKCTAAEAAGSA